MLRTRVLSAALLAPIVAAVAWVGGAPVEILVALVALLAARELVLLLGQAEIPTPMLATLAGVLAVVAGELGWIDPWLPSAVPFVLPAAVIGLALVVFAAGDARAAFLGWAGGCFALVYLGLLMPAIALVGDLPAPSASGAAAQIGLRAGAAWLLTLLALVWGYDSGAYFTGRALGRRRLAAAISPGKTVEGLIGGLLAATVVAAAACWLLGLPIWQAPILGPLVGLAAQAGDLAESLVKRAAGAKESGSLIPGHGGMLDRVDSFLFAAPALLAYAAWLAGVSPVRP